MGRGHRCSFVSGFWGVFHKERRKGAILSYDGQGTSVLGQEWGDGGINKIDK